MSEEYFKYYSVNRSGQLMSPSVYRLLEILDRSAGRGETPDIAECAARLGISAKHLNRLFADEVGISPHRFFNKRRLIHSQHLLLSNAFSITEIAHRLGFADSAHFCRSFKDLFECTPSQFKQIRESERNRPDQPTGSRRKNLHVTPGPRGGRSRR